MSDTPKPLFSEPGPYVGIGSRKTPAEILSLMMQIATELDKRRFTLRSGGAQGADQSFEAGVSSGRAEIYLPWKGFESRSRGTVFEGPLLTKAVAISAKHHPTWNSCTEGAKKLLTRNVGQVLGQDLAAPAKFVICWTEKGQITGGTGHTIRIAREYNVPVINLHNEPLRARLTVALSL